MALAVLCYLAFEIGPPILLVAAVCLGCATRAIAPWLLLPVIGLVWASLTGIDLFALMIPDPPGWFLALTGWLGARPVMLLFALLPWALAWWPLKRLGRALARAYTRKTLSDLMVLRVFQHDERIQALFEAVIERWRLTGNNVLIAGTDLLDRTIDADDIFTFIDGRLAWRFIQRPADVAARSDVVLMDLRSFKSHNEGCRHELGVLSQAARSSRVEVVTDGETDRAAALSATEAAPDGRFVWLDTSRSNRAGRREVLESLFANSGAATGK